MGFLLTAWSFIRNSKAAQIAIIVGLALIGLKVRDAKMVAKGEKRVKDAFREDRQKRSESGRKAEAQARRETEGMSNEDIAQRFRDRDGEWG